MPSFDAHSSSDKDISLAQAQPWHECPRRYCWWWQSLGFDWDTPVEKGCRFLQGEHPPGVEISKKPCVRCDSSSVIDQYEPREPHLIEDGFDEYAFTDPRRVDYIRAKQGEFQKMLKEKRASRSDDV